MNPAAQSGSEAALPALREDLELLPASSLWTGAPSWLIHDRVRNSYFRISERLLGLLVIWKTVPASTLARIATARTGEDYSEEEIQAFARFLLSNSLVVNSDEDGWRDQLAQSRARQRSLWKRMVHNYLFFKIPLFRPKAFLDVFWPFAAPFLTRNAAIVFALTGIISLYLVSRQWSVFVSTFLDFLSPEGFVLYAISLVLIKIIHELGHAFMARKYGVEVPVIGAAFIVLMPILYTDTTGAHRLKERSKKLHIDLAGIYAEMALACLATFLWVFLSDGPLRSIAFSTATLSWIISLAVNLNPFMRFDGYYILSDLTGFENLQERGFAIAKWRLREILFGLNLPIPEALPRQWILPIVLHAWGTWIYRFFLFLGIALIVYAFFIKLVGIALFIIEIYWFILLPVWREVATWWEMRKSIMRSFRSLVSVSLLLILALAVFIPWSQTVSLPAMAKTNGLLAIHPTDEGQIRAINLEEGKAVRKGEVLAVLSSPDLEEQLLRSIAERQVLLLRLARTASDRREQALRLVLERELEAKRKEVDGLQRLSKQLEIRAPVAGQLVNVDADLRPNMWISPSSRIAFVRPGSTLIINAYADENGRKRINEKAEGRFFPENPQLPPIPVKVSRLGDVAITHLEERVLADVYGGSISVNPSGDGSDQEMKPRKTWFPVQLKPHTGQIPQVAWATVLRGTVKLEGEAESLASRIGQRVATVFLREFGL